MGTTKLTPAMRAILESVASEPKQIWPQNLSQRRAFDALRKAEMVRLDSAWCHYAITPAGRAALARAAGA